ncbi:hypothetical protein SKAU_G00247660 [Synaphobranchus kaupii]|uniref:MAM domain-containing protein n=1 Tax=Synaphobranchus kaupii TaxID=118154 RepID=A0A9Q1F2B3_SYNKA|nr:hypothetical protein SKAU_G00247660 [Synaphobranchus kaupii]
MYYDNKRGLTAPAAGCTFDEDSDPSMCEYSQGEEDDFDWQLIHTYSSPHTSADLLRVPVDAWSPERALDDPPSEAHKIAVALNCSLAVYRTNGALREKKPPQGGVICAAGTMAPLAWRHPCGLSLGHNGAIQEALGSAGNRHICPDRKAEEKKTSYFILFLSHNVNRPPSLVLFSSVGAQHLLAHDLKRLAGQPAL